MPRIRAKREEERAKREEGRGKREEERGKWILQHPSHPQTYHVLVQCLSFFPLRKIVPCIQLHCRLRSAESHATATGKMLQPAQRSGRSYGKGLGEEEIGPRKKVCCFHIKSFDATWEGGRDRIHPQHTMLPPQPQLQGGLQRQSFLSECCLQAPDSSNDQNPAL